MKLKFQSKTDYKCFETKKNCYIVIETGTQHKVFGIIVLLNKRYNVHYPLL